MKPLLILVPSAVPLGWRGTCTACGQNLATADGLKAHNLHASAGERTYQTDRGARVVLAKVEGRAA